MLSIENLLEKLKQKEEVEAAFMTGSYGIGKHSSESDFDLVVILRNNKEHIRSVYTWVDGIFADIFFFDHATLQRIQTAAQVSSNSMDGIFITWLQKASIAFDNDGLLTTLHNSQLLFSKISLPDQEKRDVWQKINYNFVSNTRYFNSSQQVYKDALELRLLYSVFELVSGFLALRGIAWRGEKEAIKYLQEKAPDFFVIYTSFNNAVDIQERFHAYAQMVTLVFPEGYELWSKEAVVVVGEEGAREGTADNFWERLIA